MTSNIFKEYYQNYFPVDSVIKFYDNANIISHREWSTLSGNSNSWVRFAINSSMELKNKLSEYAPTDIKTGNYRYDVGPIWDRPYNEISRNRHFKMENKESTDIPRIISSELKFDIDLSDYTEERKKCGCNGGDNNLDDNKYKICEKCWILLCASCDIIDQILISRKFNPNKIVWIFTGGRGLHCWVREHLNMNQNARKILYETISKTKIVDYPKWADKLREANMPIPNNVIVDKPVTTDITHMTRGVFSPHSTASSRCLISTPILPPSRDNVSNDLEKGYNYMISNVAPSIYDLKNNEASRQMLNKSIAKLHL